VYGLGCCAQFGGPIFKNAAAQVMQSIQQVMGAPNARSKENVMATDNAVSALGKTIEFHSDSIGDRAVAMQAFLSYLPVTGDAAEGAVVHTRLLTFLENGEPVVFENPEQWLPKILNVLAEVLDTEAFDEGGSARWKQLMLRLQQDAHLGGITAKAFQSLDASGQSKINTLMAA